MDIIIGIDLAKYNDYTAIVVMNSQWQVLSVERLAHAAYKDQVKHIEKYINHKSKPYVFVDGTGVGSGVYEMIEAVADNPEKLHSIHITGGEKVTLTGDNIWRVSKEILISSLNRVLNEKILKFLCDYESKKIIKNELHNFFKLDKKKKYGASKNHNDDLVIALSFCIFGKLWLIDK